MAAHKCSQAGGEITLTEQSIGHCQRADAVVGEATSRVEQPEFARRSRTPFKPRANNVPSDRAKHARASLNGCAKVKRRAAKGVSLETCSFARGCLESVKKSGVKRREFHNRRTVAEQTSLSLH
jgi:hypothetical protein